MRKFDLNIEKVLEDWEIYHGVREIIANALDEQMLTNTKDIEIKKEKGRFIIKDYGRGLRYEHLTQNENKEKISNPQLVIGKFGVGLKDALATFDRHDIKVVLRSKYGDMTIDKSSKHGFDDIVTLHAIISEPSDSHMVGTEVILEGCKQEDIDKAKELFLKFSGDKVLEKTQYGEILQKSGKISKIYINGIRVAEEENFLLSYNITSMTSIMRKALNRERTHVGRTAYTERVKSILLASNKKEVSQLLIEDLQGYQTGTQHDEMKYLDIAVHACKILNTYSHVVFVTPQQLQYDTMAIDNAKMDGLGIIIIPETISQKIRGETDISGNMMRDLHLYNEEWNASFEFKFVRPENLSKQELEIFNTTSKIFELIGGRPNEIHEILISETMRREETGIDAGGLWEADKRRIVIKRAQLGSLEKYAGTLLHETAHAKSGAGDISREFEGELTNFLGKTSSQ